MQYQDKIVAAVLLLQDVRDEAKIGSTLDHRMSEAIRRITEAKQGVDHRVTGLLAANNDLVMRIRETLRQKEDAEAMCAVMMGALVDMARHAGMTRSEVEDMLRRAKTATKTEATSR